LAPSIKAMESPPSTSSLFPQTIESQTLAVVIVICNVVIGADLSMFVATMKAMEEYFKVDPMALGFVLLIQGLACAFTAPIWGMLADRHDRINLLCINLLGISVLTFLTGMSYTFPMLCVARLLTGIFSSGLGPIVQTMLASAVQPDERGKFFSYLVVAGNIGGSMGGIYGASLSHVETFEHQGWRFTYISMSFVTLAIATSFWLFSENLHKLLRRALVTSNFDSSFKNNFLAIFSKNSFLLLLCQGAMASTAIHARDFAIEIFQYAGFADFQASTLVSWNAIGQICGALMTGFSADIAAKKYPQNGRIVFGTCGNLVVICILMALGIFGIDGILNVRHYWALGAICFFMGVFQLFAYVGAVKPILSEIVPRRLTGQTLAYAAGIDGAFSAVCGAPLVAAIAEKVFGYEPTEQKVEDMTQDLRKNNLTALSRSFWFVCTICMVLATMLFVLLSLTYYSDKKASEAEDGEDQYNEHSSLRATLPDEDKTSSVM